MSSKWRKDKYAKLIHSSIKVGLKEEGQTEIEIIESLLHETGIHRYFIRLSSKEKVQYLTKILNRIQSVQSLGMIVNTFFPINTKLIQYSKVTNESNFIYDKDLLDHNRSLCDTVLHTTMEKDLSWFEDLTDFEQTSIVISLMRLAGGYIIKKMYWRFVRIFNNRVYFQRHTENNDNVVLQDPSLNFPNNYTKCYTFPPFQSDFSEENDNAQYSVTGKFYAEITEGRNNWKAMINKAQKELEIEYSKLNNKTDNIKNKENPQKTKPNQKTNPSRKEVPTSCSLDLIQLLPLWIAKKIFLYLDIKDFANVKHVNNYWEVISKSVEEEKKVRKMLDEAILNSEKLLEGLLDPQVIQKLGTVEKIKSKHISSVVKKEKLKKLNIRGAVSKKLAMPEDDMHENSIIQTALQLMKPSVSLKNMKPFPMHKDDFKLEPLFKSYSPLPEGNLVTVPDHVFEVPSEQPSLKKSSSSLSLVPSIVVTEENLANW